MDKKTKRGELKVSATWSPNTKKEKEAKHSQTTPQGSSFPPASSSQADVVRHQVSKRVSEVYEKMVLLDKKVGWSLQAISDENMDEDDDDQVESEESEDDDEDDDDKRTHRSPPLHFGDAFQMKRNGHHYHHHHYDISNNAHFRHGTIPEQSSLASTDPLIPTPNRTLFPSQSSLSSSLSPFSPPQRTWQPQDPADETATPEGPTNVHIDLEPLTLSIKALRISGKKPLEITEVRCCLLKQHHLFRLAQVGPFMLEIFFSQADNSTSLTLSLSSDSPFQRRSEPSHRI